MNDQPEPTNQGENPPTRFRPEKHEPDLQSNTRIVLRPIGSPLPLGFFTVAIDSVSFSALQWGIIPQSSSRAVGLVVFPAFVVQAIVGVFAFFGRDSGAATLMLSFATTWLVDALILGLRPSGADQALGLFLIVFSVFVAIVLTSALPRRSLAAVLTVAVPRYFVTGLALVTNNHTVAKAGGALGFLLAVVALYTAFALLWEDTRGKQLLPVGREGEAKSATKGTLATQLKGIERQAGVRRTL